MATSHGRDVKLDGQEANSLEQHPGVQRYFAEANQNDPSQSMEVEQDQGQGSSMVEQDKPEPELKPDPELAADQDRETFNDKWSSEQDAAREAMMERYHQQLDRGDRGSEPEQDLSI